MSVWLSLFTRKVMVEHCKVAYPHEGCGLLIGKRNMSDWEIYHIVPTVNIKKEQSHNRFEISPKDYLRLEKEAGTEGLSVVGFFHSHPDVPPYPSDMDVQFSWPNYLMVIISVYGGQKTAVKTYLLNEKNQTFHEIPTYVLIQKAKNFSLETRLEVNDYLDLLNEVEPFVTITVKDALKRQPSKAIVLIKFNHPSALANLPKALQSAGYLILLLRWNEEGYWELFAQKTNLQT